MQNFDIIARSDANPVWNPALWRIRDCRERSWNAGLRVLVDRTTKPDSVNFSWKRPVTIKDRKFLQSKIFADAPLQCISKIIHLLHYPGWHAHTHSVAMIMRIMFSQHESNRKYSENFMSAKIFCPTVVYTGYTPQYNCLYWQQTIMCSYLFCMVIA